MTDFPWIAKHRLEPHKAGVLGHAAFGLPCEDVVELGEGWDFVNYLADGKWVLRFPKRAECDRALVREKEILERLHVLSLPASVPRFEHFSSHCDGFPWHFAAYRYLEGTPLSDIDDEAIVSVGAPAIGEFLAALHHAPIEAELPSPWDDDNDGAGMSREFKQSIGAYPTDLRKRLDAYLQKSGPADPDVPRVLAHADLLGDHILVDPKTGELKGVIDWADACTRIRCADFAGLFFTGGRGYTERAYAAYNVEPDANEWRWLEHSAIAIGIGEVYYGFHNNQPKRVAKGLDRIRRYLP